MVDPESVVRRLRQIGMQLATLRDIKLRGRGAAGRTDDLAAFAATVER